MSKTKPEYLIFPAEPEGKDKEALSSGRVKVKIHNQSALYAPYS